MLPNVQQDVAEGVPYLARRAQLAGMVPVAPHAAVGAQRAVHRLGDADGETAEPA